MELNVPLLRKMVEWAEWQEQLTEGREWYQPRYVTRMNPTPRYCGTAYCLAGKIAVDAGWTPIFEGVMEVTATLAEKDGVVDSIDGIALDAFRPSAGIPEPVLGQQYRQ